MQMLSPEREPLCGDASFPRWSAVPRLAWSLAVHAPLGVRNLLLLRGDDPPRAACGGQTS
jgi:hypothetical protein